MDKEIKKIEKDLLARHADDPIKLSKVHRYIRFLKIDLKCDDDIDKDGTTIKIENGTQNFLKQHPAIATKLSISKEIEKLEDALGIKNEDIPSSSSTPSTVDDKGRKSLILISHKYIDEYIKLWRDGKIILNKRRIKLVELIERDILTVDDMYFDEEQIENYITFTEKYYFPLTLTQKFKTCFIFLYYNDGSLVFDEHLDYEGRGGGKTGRSKMMRIQHIEHAYECKHCKMDATQKAQMKRGKAPQAVIQRSIAGPTVLAKLIYDKFIQYLPLYRQVKEWERYGLLTNDKNLSNWVIRAAEDWLLPIYEQMKQTLTAKSVLHVDETYAQIIKRSDGKSGQSNAYNWVFRSVPSQGPIIVLFQSALSRSRSVLEEFTEGFKGTVICDGYSAYGNLPNVTFANCWAHVRRYWLKADSKNGQIGVDYCDQLYHLERQFKHLSPGKRRKARQKHSKPIVEKFLKWVDESPFFGKNALAKAAEYTLNRVHGLKAFLFDGRIEIDNNPVKNAIRPNVIGRKNWLFSVSEAGAKANAICLSLAETAKANGIDFY